MVISLVQSSKATSGSVDIGMGDHTSMLISGDSLSDETLNRGPLALLSQRQYEFLFDINTVQLTLFL